jgi:hypothetical protein
MFTWTDRPYESMWEHLRVLSHENNAHRLLMGLLSQGRTFPAPSRPSAAAKAQAVAYCITQAYEYYQAAEAVTINTSPLLYFYGMLSLAKALIVANSPDKLLDDIKYHGLTFDKTVGRTPEIDNQVAIVKGGVFDELTYLTSGFRYPHKAAIRLRDVLSISPEIADMYERYYGQPSRLFYHASQVISFKNPYRIELSVSLNDPQEAYNRIPELATDFTVVGRSPAHPYINFRSTNLQNDPDYMAIYRPVVGGQYIVGGLPFIHAGTSGRRYLSPAVSDYIAMFLLGDCVRYQQDLWGSVVEGKNTGILGLITLLIGISKRRFPNMILDKLFGEPCEYGSPGRLM